jgi:hypothetical protein
VLLLFLLQGDSPRGASCGHPNDDVIVLSSSDGINLSYAISIQDIKNEG